MRMPCRSNILALAVLSFGLAATTVAAPPAAQDAADWPRHNRDLAATRYSPLTEINTENVADL